MISEIARAAGIPVSQLFRWLKKLRPIEEPKSVMATLVLVIGSETALSVSAVQPEPPTHLNLV
jgi:transposase